MASDSHALLVRLLVVATVIATVAANRQILSYIARVGRRPGHTSTAPKPCRIQPAG
jgi:hypothetical protein